MVRKIPDKSPSVPLSNRQWKEHLAIKRIHTIDELNAYAGELAVEMSIYCHNRLLNIQENIKAISQRFRHLKKLKSGKKATKNAVLKTSRPKEKF